MSSLLLTDEPGRARSDSNADRRGAAAVWIAVAVALAAVLGTWLGSGVAPSVVARFVVFEALWVVLPGCLLYVLLSPAPGGWLRTLAIGWPLGYAIEVGAFALTAALNVRGALALLPLISLPLAGPILVRRLTGKKLSLAFREGGRGEMTGEDPPEVSPGRSAGPERRSWRMTPELLVAVAVTAAVLLLAFTFFASSPLPEHARSVSYSEDNVFDVAIAAEARHHWPVTEAWVAGEPLRYYLGVFIHAAALNQVLGISLAVSFLRLLPSTMFLIAALQLWALGSGLGRSRWIGPLAAVLLLVTQDVNLDPLKLTVLQIDPFTQFPLSPSFAFGIPFFLGGLLLLQTRVVAPGLAGGSPRKGGTGEREVGTGAHGGGTGGTGIRDDGTGGTGGTGIRDDGTGVAGMCDDGTGGTASGRGARQNTVSLPRENIGGLLLMVAVFSAGLAYAKAFGAFDFVGGLGVYWLWQLARHRVSRTLTLCLAAAGMATLAIYFLAISGGGSATMTVHPLAFLQEGNTLERATKVAKQVAGPSLYWILLAAGGAVLAVLALAPLLGAAWLLWRERRVPDNLALLLAVFVVGMGGYALLGAPGGVEGVFFVYGYIALVPVAALGLVRLWAETPRAVRLGLARAGAGLVALAVLVAAISGSVDLTGAERDAWLVLAYGAIAGAATWAVWRLQRGWRPVLASRWLRVAACCIPLLAALALVKPVTLAGSGAWKTVVGKPTSARDEGGEYGMTAALYSGLLWVRAHTSSCDVLAVSNVWESAAKDESAYFYYPAFAERRVWLESWHYTAGGQTGALPYPGRFALNQSAIQQGNPTALRELARRGVKYVLVNNTHGGGAAEPASVSTLVYSSPAMKLYRLQPVTGAPHGCGVVT